MLAFELPDETTGYACILLPFYSDFSVYSAVTARNGPAWSNNAKRDTRKNIYHVQIEENTLPHQNERHALIDYPETDFLIP